MQFAFRAPLILAADIEGVSVDGAIGKGASMALLDFQGENLKAAGPPENIRGLVTASTGSVKNTVTQPNPETGGWRLSFELAPGRESLCELRAQLMQGDLMLSEVWLYRWTA